MDPDTGNSSGKVIVIGVGNSFRSDDGVGVYVARELQKLHLPEVTVVTEERDGLKIMDHWSSGDHVVIIDAVVSDADEGSILRVELLDELRPSFISRSSTHSFDIAGAVSLSKVVGKLPASVVLYGVEGKNFKMGTSLSPRVLAAARRTLQMVLQEISALSASTGNLRLKESA